MVQDRIEKQTIQKVRDIIEKIAKMKSRMSTSGLVNF